jgi:hypothetical protein
MRGKWQHGVIGGLAVYGLMVLGAGTAGATLQNSTAYKKTYPEAKGVSCKVCHLEAIGKSANLNTYGKALQAFTGAGQGKAMTVEDFKAFETDDLDKDGVLNQQEINAGTDPSDPKSVPPAAGS